MQEVPFGCLDVDGGDLIQIKEKPAVENLVNAGVYVLSPELIATVPPRSFPITELFEFGLQNNVRLGAFEVEDEWLDVGHKEQLRRAREGG